MLRQRIDGSLGRSVSGQRADGGPRRERPQEHDAAPLMQDRQKLLHEEEWRADVDCEERVEILDRVFLDRRRLGDAGVGDENVQPWGHDCADLLGQLVRAVRRREIARDGVGAASGLADLGDNGFGPFRAAAVMDEHLGTVLPFASAKALARPMPREAPVTRAVFPERLPMICKPHGWILIPGAVLQLQNPLVSLDRDDGGEWQPLGRLEFCVVISQRRGEKEVGVRHEEFRVLVEGAVALALG